MVIMAPGYFCTTAFPDRFFADDYWADYGFKSILRATPTIITPSNTPVVLGRTAELEIL